MSRELPPESGEQERLQEADLLGPGLIHEMRHPLMGIKAGLELLARRLDRDVTSSEDWELVANQVARLEELFRGYQQLFTPTGAPPVRFAVEPVLQRAVDLLAWRLRRFGGRFEWHRDGAHQAKSAPNALLHAAINLLTNAADAAEETNGRIALRVLADPLEIRISDEGTGVADEHVFRLFTPNFTTKPEGRGTGLGLHIARKAMSRAGGDVRFVDPADPRRLPWARAEFVVTLPGAE